MNKQSEKVAEHLLEQAMKKEWPCTETSGQGNREYNVLVNDLEHYPHLFVLSCLMDRQKRSDDVCDIPYRICKEFAPDYTLEQLASHSQQDYIDWFLREKPHRFNSTMAQVFYEAVHRIADVYDGDVSRIWKGEPKSSEVIYQFLCFKGCGVKIATMTANLLHRDHGVKYADYSSLDVSPDVHTLRVMNRLGLIDEPPLVEYAIYRARSIYPEYPGIIDKVCWEIGRTYCHPQNPDCTNCPMKSVCPSNGANT